MTRPRKVAMSGIADVLRGEMEPDGELDTLMRSLPAREQAAFAKVVWGLIENINSRAMRLPNTPLGPQEDGA